MRAFPGLIPQTPDAPGGEAAASSTSSALRADGRPKLVLWGAAGPRAAAQGLARRSSRRSARTDRSPIEGAGHFLQEDKGAEIGAHIADWLGSGA